MIETRQLSFGYSGNAPIFDSFTFAVDKRDAWSIIGPSGCGKTTLLYLLAGLRKPDQGSILIGGSKIKRPRPLTGLVLQDHGLLPWATVRENARLGLKIRKFYGPDGRHAPADKDTTNSGFEERIDYWLQRLGIDQLGNQYPIQLSRGQRQRTGIARTMALEPDLLLMDEPFSALDAGTSEDLQNIVLELHQETDLTSIIVTHNIEEAVYMGDKILALNNNINKEPQIIENGYKWDKEFRIRPEFNAQCEKLRNILKEES